MNSNTPGLVDQSIGLVKRGVDAIGGLFKGAESRKPTAAKLNIKTTKGTSPSQDLRVRIKVPEDYYQASPFVGSRAEEGTFTSTPIVNFQGIIFPYTPSISYDAKADYGTQAPVHSNFSQYFYQRSGVGSISISGRFTVQNENEARIYLSTTHLLRALTKMRFGKDADAGSPPPVCRLFAYGQYMLDNIPVAITNVRIELPDSVDYFTLGKLSPDPDFGVVSVPTLSTISITCNIMYSRREMQEFSVDKYLNKFDDKEFRKAGYL